MPTCENHTAAMSATERLIALSEEQENREYFYFLNPPSTDALMPQKIRCFYRTCKASSQEMNGIIHNSYGLIVNLKTAAKVIVDGKTVRLNPGNALLVFPNQYHFYSPIKDDKLCWFFVAFSAVDPGYFHALRNTPVPVNDEFLDDLFCLAEKYTTGRGKISIPHFTMQIGLRTSLLLQLLLDARKWEKHSALDHMAEALESSGNKWVYLASLYIRDHIDHSLSAEEIANHLSISSGHLRNIFYEQLGFSIGRYVRYIKMHHACVLMDTTDDTLDDIAHQCGYSSLFSFSKAFKKDKGISPSIYRRKYCSGGAAR